ncbi:N-acyl homoserine lactonase family protein [Noviherbaspirillum sedimenti]|nr:N-acyl homoserine lactonase family protein [Noviherbaspirillum sedimenti]
MPDSSRLPKMETSEDGIYQVYSLCYARARSRHVHENFMIRDMHDGPMPMDFNLWILRNAHRTVLVDTGFSQRAANERRPLDFDPIEALARLDIDPDAIEDVIISHLHFDHAGNIDRFAKARFHVQDAEVAYATGRCMCDRTMRLGFDVEDVVTLVRHTYAERVCFHDGDATPLPGISLHVLPGHTAGIQAVRVMTPRGPVVLASDVSHFYANFLRRGPFAATLDATETLRSYEKLKEIAGAVERIIPGHDPKVRMLYPSYTFNGIELTALHEEPKQHDINTLARLESFA